MAVQPTRYSLKTIGWQDVEARKEVRHVRLGLTACVIAAVIFGVLAGLFMWKGKVLSLGNRKLCAVGFSNSGVALLAVGFAAWLGYRTRQATKGLGKQEATDLPWEQIVQDSRFANLHEDVKKEVLQGLLQGNPQHFPLVAPYLSLASNFSLAYLDDRLNQPGFRLEDQPDGFRDEMVAYIIAVRSDKAPLITNPAWLPEGAQLSDAFLAAYLATNPDLGQTQEGVRPVLMNFIVGNGDHAGLVTHPVWLPEGAQLSDAFLAAYLATNPDLSKLNEPVRRTVIDFIIRHVDYARLITNPAWFADEHVLTDAFLAVYLRTHPDLSKMKERVRLIVINFIIRDGNHAGLVTNPAWLPEGAQLSDAFLAAYLRTNPDLGQTKKGVRDLIVTYINDNLICIHLVIDPSWTEHIQRLDESLVRQFAAHNDTFLTRLVNNLLMNKTEVEIVKQIPQESLRVQTAIINQLTTQQILEILKDVELVQNLADCLPKSPDYQMPEALKKLWSNEGASFANWLCQNQDSRLQQMLLINDFTEGLRESARLAANLKLKSLAGRNFIVKNQDNSFYLAVINAYKDKDRVPQIFRDAGIY